MIDVRPFVVCIPQAIDENVAPGNTAAVEVLAANRAETARWPGDAPESWCCLRAPVCCTTTSRIIRDYPADRPAGAALHLFASIALMLWYVLRILISLATNDD